MMPRPRRYREVRGSKPRRDRDVWLTVSRRDRDVQKNASRPSRDRDVRDRDYNPEVVQEGSSHRLEHAKLFKHFIAKLAVGEVKSDFDTVLALNCMPLTSWSSVSCSPQKPGSKMLTAKWMSLKQKSARAWQMSSNFWWILQPRCWRSSEPSVKNLICWKMTDDTWLRNINLSHPSLVDVVGELPIRYLCRVHHQARAVKYAYVCTW